MTIVIRSKKEQVSDWGGPSRGGWAKRMVHQFHPFPKGTCGLEDGRLLCWHRHAFGAVLARLQNRADRDISNTQKISK